MELLSLYKAQKLAMELTGLSSSQQVDMCPDSCMAFTGEFEDQLFCTYVHNKCDGLGCRPCGQPHYDKKG